MEKNKKQSINELDLSVRLYNCLKRAGIDTVEDLSNKTKEDIMRIRNMGRKTLDELTDKMRELGVWFKEN